MSKSPNRPSRRQRRGRAYVDSPADSPLPGGGEVERPGSAEPSVERMPAEAAAGDATAVAAGGEAPERQADRADPAGLDSELAASAATRIGVAGVGPTGADPCGSAPPDPPATSPESTALDTQAARRSREGGSDDDIPWHLRPWRDDEPRPPAADSESGGDGHGHAGGAWPPDVQPHHHAWVYAVAALFLLSLAFGAWGLWTVFRPVPIEGTGDVRRQNERLRQEVSTLKRSDQISREANRDLQRTLAERDEEIAGLRADVAFYERFVGATGQRRGLSVHELQLQREQGDAWRFVATLTQNLNRGAINSGRLTVSVEGNRDGRLQRLAWTQLRQQTAEPGLAYSFKYFQQVEGNLILPAGFEPLRVSVRLVPEGGSAVEQSFPWTDVATEPRAQAGGLR